MFVEILRAAPAVAGATMLAFLHLRVLYPCGRKLVSGLDMQIGRAQFGRVRRRVLHTEQAQPTAEQGVELAFRVERPRLTFRDLHSMAERKGRLLKAGRAALCRGGPVSNGLLLYGKLGNGKTAQAVALAGELGVGFMSLSTADPQSKWVGQTTEQLVSVFHCAQAQAPCVLLVDEIDSIIRDRSSAQATSEEGPPRRFSSRCRATTASSA